MTLQRFLFLANTIAWSTLKADSSRYFFGYFWWIIEPLLYVLVFYLVFEVLLRTGRDDFLVFLMCGKLLFIWFSKSVSLASNSLVMNVGLLGRLDLPKPLFPFASILEGLYKQAAVFLLLFIFLLLNDISPTTKWLWLIPILLATLLFILALSFIGATLVCVFRDTMLLIPLGMIFLMFASGIFWDIRDIPDPTASAMLLKLNPVAFLIDAFRAVLMYDEPPNLFHLVILLVCVSVTVGISALILTTNSKYLAMRVLSS